MIRDLSKVIERGVVVWALIMGIETVHGVLRTQFLLPLVGDLRARQISVFTGSLIILGIAFVFVRWLKGSTAADYLLVGAVWVIMTVILEIVIGRYVMQVTWDRIASDYDILHGGLMSMGLVVMLLAPLIMAKFTDEI
jgi:hypothetical protein